MWLLGISAQHIWVYVYGWGLGASRWYGEEEDVITMDIRSENYICMSFKV